MKQKLQLLIAILFACTSLVTAQSDASVQGNMHVHLGGNLAFFGALDVPVAGLLRNEAGSLFTRSTISGEERIQMDEAANLDIANGTFTFRNEIDEKFTNLTIASNGIVEVVPGNSLEISGTLANHNSTMTDSLAGVNLYANSSGYAQLLTSGGISVPGTVFAQQFLTSTTTAGWRELSSPVNTTLSEVADDYPLYFNNTGSSRQWNVWWYDAQPATSNTGADNPISNISKANAQYYKPANSNDAFSGDRAYSIYVGGPFFPEITSSSLSVRGEPGHGSFIYTLYKTHDMGYSNPVASQLSQTPFDGDPTQPASLITGWNLIPNPYPSNIDVSTLITEMGLAYEAVHVWDAPNQQYFPITKDAAFPTINWNTEGTPLNDNNIPPFQAFWVKADLHEFSPGEFGGSSTVTSTIALQNSFRTVEKGSSFFKRTPTHIVLRVRNQDTTKTDQTIVTLDEGNHNGLDFKDALKMKSPNNEVPTMSTIVEEHPLAINRLSMPNPGHAVALSVTHNTNGEKFFIDALEYETDLSWTLHIFDWKTKTLHDLKEDGAYEFINDINFKGNNRFTFYINYKAAGYDPFNIVNIWGSRNGIEVSFANPTTEDAAIEIMDIAGRRLFFTSNVRTTENFVWPVDGSEPSVYVVRVTSGDSHKITRVLR